MPDLFENSGRCHNCKAYLKGRSDKKFCSLKCKNAWHNAQNKQKNLKFKYADIQMHKNWVALDKYYNMSQGTNFISIILLYQQGFNPEFYNGNVTINETGEKLYVVYDYGFIINQESKIKIYYYDWGFNKIQSS